MESQKLPIANCNNKIMNSKLFVLTTFAVAFTCLPLSAQDAVEFSRDVRPILSDTCFKCHGPDEAERAAGLRLDLESGVFEDADVIERGDAEGSDLYQRLISGDPDLQMPPPDSGRKLTDKQKETIKRWIDSGANWQKHWSFVTPSKPAVPVTDSEFAKNEIDHFVLAKLQQLKIQPNPRANRSTLIRRLFLDLTGLPPTPKRFAKHRDNRDENWYESLVDELLESPHYGEHMARFWLDAARYGDTHGLHLDNYREIQE